MASLKGDALSDDEDGWMDMPVLHSTTATTKLAVNRQWKEYREDPDRLDQEEESSKKIDSSDDDDDDEDVLQRQQRRRRIQLGKGKVLRVGKLKTAALDIPSPTTQGTNATGNLIDVDEQGAKWREKGKMDEKEYTRLELDEDPEEDEMHTRTKYLFDDDKGMTPLSQMQTTKQMLSEAQRIAYVGLCRVVTREMVRRLANIKELDNARESLNNWGTKIMGRLYQHMEVEPAEQRMIEQLAEHGVTSADLVPSLVAVHTVPNPEYDPEVEREQREVEERERREAEEQAAREKADADRRKADEAQSTATAAPEGQEAATGAATSEAAGQYQQPKDNEAAIPQSVPLPMSPTVGNTTAASTSDMILQPLPNALPGVSTKLTAADKTITLDIRWTILCDLFLALVADSVYDARSRVLLGLIAEQLGLTWMDIIRFEKRLTEALELQEAVSERENKDVIDLRRKAENRKRYMMMGLATLGGGLVIGLSAGLLAPVIGAGIGAAFATVGVSGTTAFLGGAGGAAVITTSGTLIGGRIGGKGMARRMKAVDTFNLMPLHNNKRLNVIITIPGFMNGPQDDVRLPFSTLNPIMGDVFSVLWEPETLGQTGGALRILGSEVLSSVGQQMLQLTLMGAMMAALQWPILLTKLGYLIDNPWSNALDRARQAGEVMAQILINRSVGVRPVTLIGFSLGARVIFYTLVALAKAKAYGIVQDVYLLGATVTGSRKTWQEVSGVVSGRFVNAYAQNDWILGYLFRATVGGLQTVAGLRPVEYVPGLENVDITELIAGHMSYRTLMPLILEHLGFKVTATSFDEPEDLDAKPEREIVTPEMELARLEAQKKASWIQRLRKNKKDASSPASTDMSRPGSVLSNGSSADGKPNNNSKSNLASGNIGAGYDEEDDSEPVAVVGGKAPINVRRPYDELESDIASRLSVTTVSSATVKKEKAPVKKPVTSPVGAGFDIAQIREEIAKDDGSGQLASTQTVSLKTQIPAATQSNRDLPSRISPESRRTPKRLSYDRTNTEPNNVSFAQQQKEQEALERQEAEYEARLAAELEEAEARTPTASTSYTTLNPFDDPSSSSSHNHPYSSTSTSTSYGFTNPFASSSASFAFNDNIGSSRSHHSSSLSFGSDDGTITHVPLADQDVGIAGASAWNSRATNGTSPDLYIKQASDPWASKEWDINPKW